MSQVVYPGCPDEFLLHNCTSCITPENGRVRHIAFVHTSVSFTDITSPVEWKAAMLLKKIHVVAGVNGTYDGGSPTIGRGYGAVPKRKTGNTFKLTVYDPNFLENCSFYNSMGNSMNYRIAFCSETVMQISDSACLCVQKDSIEEPTESERVWTLDIEFSQKNTACHVAIPGGIFLCSEVAS